MQKTGTVPPGKDAVLRSPTPENLVQLCSTLFSTGQDLEALRLALEVVSSHPDDLPLTTAAAGVISKHTARHDVVATLLRSVLLREPHDIRAQSFLAYTLIAGGDLAGGIALFSEMMARHPGERTSLCEYISVSLLNAGYPLEALQVLFHWVTDGEVTAALLNNMGCALERLGRSAEALPWYERALTMAPDNQAIAFGYALTLLKAGNFRDGFARYVDRPPRTDHEWWFLSLPRLRHGDDVAGKKIILYQEQGLGDTIQFIRSVPYLLEQGAEVTIAVPAGLVRLLAQSFPDVSVRSIAEFGREDGYSYAAPIPDLPFIAGVMSESDIPAHIPYLRADADDIARFAAMLPARRPRIGLVWAGGRRVMSEDVAADKRRSTTPAEMGAALCPVDATLVNLQFGPPRAEIEAWRGQPLFDPMGDIRDMADTAAIMGSLDLIISVDTSLVHLAGAIGRPVWLVSRWDACWRWGDEGDSSPWYPTMRVFRAREKSFAPVLREVGEALHKWVETWQAD
ncbi:tetratricopeptide repeat protein [Gluconacetobacter azotocaptans]|uniref:Tetratricopeptide repeat protein n=1 Tax=Gluconacetobacter azotocaptans TaxID=142834 RepID=A0A7W4JRJ1_9PROT|nr:tetratricopeptide repeat protein [Gluconacetobacter azotocaptans]GBQ34616.1 TPR repeat-containing protein [Gluconacetobacter azotocaptans DSM 13594]